MSDDAGADIKRGVYAAGLNYTKGELSIGAINYWSSNVINIFYTEARYGFPLGANAKLKFAAQYSDQQSVGDNRLTGSDFEAHQWGVKPNSEPAASAHRGVYRCRRRSQHVSPWSGYPGYTACRWKTSTAPANPRGCCAPLTRFQSTPA
jgi:hypothetical protein